MHGLYIATFVESDDGGFLGTDAEEQAPIYSELNAFEAKESFAKEVYANLVIDEDVKRYLDRSRHYCESKRRWNLPQADSRVELKESDMYKPLWRIFNEIIEHFYNENGKEIIRAVVLTHNEQMDHTDDGVLHLYSQPDFTVTGTGPAFKNPEKNLTQGSYDCVAGVMDARVEGGTTTEKDLCQLAVYAR
jgi:hypothetical protein